MFKDKSYLVSVILLLIVVPAVVIVSYSNTLEVPFHYDGEVLIKENGKIPHLSESINIFGPLNRSVTFASFTLNYTINGLDPGGYHIFNILIHILNCILIFLLLQKTLKLGTVRKKYRRISEILSLSSALIFAVHPLNTEAVTYIYQRATLLVTFFYILTLYIYAAARTANTKKTKILLYIIAVLTTLLALFSKPSGAVLPGIIFLYELSFLREKFPSKKTVITVLILILVFLAVYPFVIKHQKNLIDSWQKRYRESGYTPVQRFMTEWRVLPYYMSLTVFPHRSRLRPDYDFSVSKGLFTPITTLISGIFLTLLVVFALWRFKKDRFTSFGIFWFFGNLAITSTVVPVMLANEHRLYLPLIFVIPVLLLLIYNLLNIGKEILSDRDIKHLLFRKENLVVILIVVMFGFQTYQRNKYWQSEEKLWQDCMEKSPQSSRAHAQMAKVHFQKGNYKKAIKIGEKALELGAASFTVYLNLGLAHDRKGNIKKAEKYLSKALKENSKNARVLNALAIVYGKQNKIKKAEKLSRRCIELYPDNADAHTVLGRLLLKQNMFLESIIELQKAIELNPSSVPAHLNLARAKAASGNLAEAEKIMKNTLKKTTPNFETLYRLARIQVKLNKFREAEKTLRKSMRKLGMQSPTLLTDLGYILKKRGKYSEAVKKLKKAVAINSNNRKAHLTLARIYKEKNEPEKAEKHLKALKNIQSRKNKSRAEESLKNESPQIR